MAAHTLHIDLPNAERPSVWPWLVALISGAALIALTAQLLSSIPASLQLQADRRISDAGMPAISAVARGRDIHLQGSIDRNTSVASLIDSIAGIDGVRIVRDELIRIDPEETAQQQAREFLRSLARIDTTAVAFRPGSNSFTNGSDIALKQLAALLLDNPGRRIRIEGHTDDTGPAAVNLRLSQERAQAVASYLLSQGVSPGQLIAKGYGSTQPIDDNTTEAGRSRNRRIEISYVD